MKIIIFAGGTGKRFWPASRKNNPKQFQSVIGGKPLIKLKYDYLRKGFKSSDIFVSTGLKYKSEVEKILSDIPSENFIYEPSMRDTGPAVLYATQFIYDKYGDVPISIQWSDHYIKDPKTFVKILKKSEEFFNKVNKTIIIGVPIRFASPHRGHIKNGKILNKFKNYSIAEFKKFVEKPSISIAKKYIQSGNFTWNPGYFITKPSFIFSKYKFYAPETYQIINKISISGYSKKSLKLFESLDKKSFDYIFAEHLRPNEAYIIMSAFGWSDVGEWVSLKEALQKNNNSVVTSGKVLDLGSKDSLIYNYDEKKLVSTFGLKNIVVVNTKDVVAVFSKNESSKLKEYIALLEKNKLQEYL